MVSREELSEALRKGDLETVRRYSPENGNLYRDMDIILSSGLSGVQTFLRAFPSLKNQLAISAVYMHPSFPDYQEILNMFSAQGGTPLTEEEKARNRRNVIINAIYSRDLPKINQFASEGVFSGPEGKQILTETLDRIAQAARVSSDLLQWLVSSGA